MHWNWEWRFPSPPPHPPPIVRGSWLEAALRWLLETEKDCWVQLSLFSPFSVSLCLSLSLCLCLCLYVTSSPGMVCAMDVSCR